MEKKAGPNTHKSNVDLRYRVGGNGELLASFNPNDLMIKIVSDAENKLGLFSEMGVHALRHLDLFTLQEWATLENAARSQGWIESQRIRERYAEVYKGRPNLETLLIEAAIAGKYGQWRTEGQNNPYTAVTAEKSERSAPER